MEGYVSISSNEKGEVLAEVIDEAIEVGKELTKKLNFNDKELK